MIKIGIYTDYLHNNDILRERVAGAVSETCLITILNAANIINGALADQDILIMPGGADLFFTEKLNGAGNRAIDDFVVKGGRYLGICAGAYFGARAIRWAEDNEKEVIVGTRELAFVKATAIGPAYPLMQGGINDCWDGLCRLNTGGDIFHAIYRGGCYFEGTADADILAVYEDLPNRPPAIIGQQRGAGYALLSGPHIEMRAQDYEGTLYRHLNPFYEYQSTVAAGMDGNDEKVDTYWRGVLDWLIKYDNTREKLAFSL